MSDGYSIGKVVFRIKDKDKVEERIKLYNVSGFETEVIKSENLCEYKELGDIFLVTITGSHIYCEEVINLFKGITFGFAEQFRTLIECFSYFPDDEDEEISEGLSCEAYHLIWSITTKT